MLLKVKCACRFLWNSWISLVEITWLQLNSSNVKDDANFKEEGPSQKTELLRAKQDVMNRIIQIGEKV